MKLEKGKVTGRIHTIMARHLTSQKLPTSLVTEHSDTSWIVTSSDKRHEYYVTQEGDRCQVQCCLRCTKCNVCVHSYSCNCPDHLIHNTIVNTFILLSVSNKRSQIHCYMIMAQNWILILTHLHLLMKWDQNASVVAYTASIAQILNLRLYH